MFFLKLVVGDIGCLEVGSIALAAWTFVIIDAAAGSVVFGDDPLFVVALCSSLGITNAPATMTIAMIAMMMAEVSPIFRLSFTDWVVPDVPTL